MLQLHEKTRKANKQKKSTLTLKWAANNKERMQNNEKTNDKWDVCDTKTRTLKIYTKRFKRLSLLYNWIKWVVWWDQTVLHKNAYIEKQERCMFDSQSTTWCFFLFFLYIEGLRCSRVSVSVSICVSVCVSMRSGGNWVTVRPSAIHFLPGRTKRDLPMNHLLSRCITRSFLYRTSVCPTYPCRTPRRAAWRPRLLVPVSAPISVSFFLPNVAFFSNCS